MDFQFYPTPPDLAARAWRKFKNRNFVRVLEPSAGTGDLAEAGLEKERFHHRRQIPIDCCELDATKHPVLREKGFNVVGVDFFQFGDGAIYSHIILNPPFIEGVKHVLKAWNMLWDGELVAILNAETIRNLHTGERRLLASLIAEHGDVEFIDGAFASDDAERTTNVEVALVYLRKHADINTDIVGNLFEELKQDDSTKESLASDFDEANMLALPNCAVENTVLTFNAAVRAMRDSVFMNARARYYSSLLGETMAVRNSSGSTEQSASVSWVQSEIGCNYDKLKDRAWASVLRSTNVTSRLSSAAQRRLESEFEQIKKLDFTVVNIYGFLCGLMEKQGEIQIDMACDTFDLFTRYHSDNTVFYKGWRSNDKHRKCGMRLRTTRFILPGHKCESYQNSMRYESVRMLADFDKVFAMLDGKRTPEIGLADIFHTHFNDLRVGTRVSSSYFDVRYYPGAGTIHFFARDKALVERLNRLVGKHRQWLPPDDAHVSKDFWLQFEGADKFDKELRAEVQKMTASVRHHWGWAGPLQALVNSVSSGDSQERFDKAEELFDQASTVVLERHGINVDFRIEDGRQQTLRLQAA